MEGKKLVVIIFDVVSIGKWKKVFFDLKYLYNNEVFFLIIKCLFCLKKKVFLLNFCL